ncbi:MAG TPA: hypothetical protein VKA16_10405 [Burkholderiales bacterium]|nr:hypothetical protein [Burkholderiales bacterium]
MHCELLVPALFPTREPAREALAALRLPALELLLARGRAAGAEPQAPERWLVEAFSGDDSGEDAPLAAGALTVLADGGEPGDEAWLRADPVHLQLGREGPALVPSTAFEVTREEAEALCEALNRHFAGALTFYPLVPARWCARLTDEFAAPAESPLQLAGEDVNQRFAAEPAARRWHALLTEIQMALHEHPVNAERERRGAPTLNSLWLWGAGRAPREAAGPWQSVCADEPLALGMARLAGVARRALPAAAEEWLARAPEDGRHLLVLDALRAAHALDDAEAYAARLRTLEARWFAPLLAALRAGRVGMITLHVPDAADARSFETVGGDLRRIWRRAQALGRYA